MSEVSVSPQPTSPAPTTPLREKYKQVPTREEIDLALRQWLETYPDQGDTHNGHWRGRFQGECQACAAEFKLLELASRIDYQAIGALAPVEENAQ